MNAKKTAAELMAELARDENYVRMRAEKEAARLKSVAAAKQEERPILEDLAEVGLDVGSVWDFVNTPYPYPEAIPVLEKHLVKNYSVKIKEGIARALTVPEADSSWNILVVEFEEDSDTSTLGKKWALANALGFLLNEERIPDIQELVLNPRHGESRVAIVEALGKFRTTKSRALLTSLQEDSQVAKKAKAALQKMGKPK